MVLIHEFLGNAIQPTTDRDMIHGLQQPLFDTEVQP